MKILMTAVWLVGCVAPWGANLAPPQALPAAATDGVAEKGADTNGPPNVELLMSDGSRLKGHFEAEALDFEGDALGRMKVSLKQIASLEVKDGKATLVTQSGDRLAGKISGDTWKFTTCLGQLDVPVGMLSRMAVFSAGRWENLKSGLVAKWLAEGNGKDSVGGHDGALMNGVKFEPGIRGQAFRFEGSRSKVNVPDDPAFAPTNSFTIEGWFMFPERTPHGDATILFNRGDNRGGLDSYQLSMQSNGRLGFGIWDADNNVELLFSPVPKNKWVHIAAIYARDAGTMEWFVNGESTAKKETKLKPIVQLDPTQDPAVGIGNHGGQMHQWPSECLIDELGYYSRALRGDELRALYRAGEPDKPRPKPQWTTEKDREPI